MKNIHFYCYIKVDNCDMFPKIIQWPKGNKIIEKNIGTILYVCVFRFFISFN